TATATAASAYVIEYSSPNTNKPLHLGHIRNNLLGWSVAEIWKATGKSVKKVNLVNDRGIHICKSMLAWLRYGQGETPQCSGLKGDHLVGKYYVIFSQQLAKEVAEIMASHPGIEKEVAERQAPLMQEAQQMLRKWEDGDEQVLELWKTMNTWVYAGFSETYQKLGIDFDKIYYESQTYLLGKSMVEKGLKDGLLIKKEDGSVWADLREDGLDEKLLLRKDGTSVYMTQDLGTAQLRYQEFNAEKLIYVVGNEQNYHFDVLKRVLKKLGYDWSSKIEHLSYGMVELPEGKMKSREGTVVDADDLIEKMTQTAKETTEELGKAPLLENKEEANRLYHTIAMGALKYFILKVDPSKNMLFNPKESIDFNGNTGPFIQYTHARIRSLLRKSEKQPDSPILFNIQDLPKLSAKEISLIQNLLTYTSVLQQAAKTFSPAIIANYIFDTAKEFNGFYQDTPVLKEEHENTRLFRLALSQFTGTILKQGLHLLGIEAPERM
ncbi:MAG: arginine--tRNA ligase, partial [Bacteroidales bacterium]